MKQMGLTRGTKRIITQAIANLPEDKKNNKYDICEEVSNILIERFVGNIEDEKFSKTSPAYNLLEYQTMRMGLSTTSEIMHKIELYMLNRAGSKVSDFIL